MRQWSGIFDGFDHQIRLLQRRDGGFAARARAFDLHVDFLHAELDSFLRTHFRGPLSGEGGALAAALEAYRASRGPTQHVAIRVRDGDDGVIERGLDMAYPAADVTPGFSFFALCHVSPKTSSS